MPSPRHWFISDTHFCAHRPAHIDAFKRLCDTINQGDTLLLLGDIFEIWVSDDIADECTKSIEACLKACISRGIEVIFMHGNRDFLVGQHFSERTGVSIISDPYIWTLPNGRQALLTHGDWFCTDDPGYRRYRKVVRNRFFQSLFKCLPTKTKLHIAQKIRQSSLKSHERGGNRSYDANSALIQRYFDTYAPITTIIMGHTHLPNVHSHKDRNRIVLGDWRETLWYGIASAENGFELFEAPLSLDQPKLRFSI